MSHIFTVEVFPADWYHSIDFHCRLTQLKLPYPSTQNLLYFTNINSECKKKNLILLLVWFSWFYLQYSYKTLDYYITVLYTLLHSYTHQRISPCLFIDELVTDAVDEEDWILVVKNLACCAGRGTVLNKAAYKITQTHWIGTS